MRDMKYDYFDSNILTPYYVCISKIYYKRHYTGLYKFSLSANNIISTAHSLRTTASMEIYYKYSSLFTPSDWVYKHSDVYGKCLMWLF
jgi:hypothetical protein